MITTKRVLLIASEEFIQQLNFEAIRQIQNIEDCDKVWGNNKTPVISKKIFKQKGTIPILEVPDFQDLQDFVNFCHVNGFECGEIVHSQKFDTRKDTCFLCRLGNLELKPGISSKVEDFNHYTKKESDVIIYKSDNFFVKVELGCMIPGMLMINPTYHTFSMARLEDAHYKEYYQVMEDVEILLKATYTDYYEKNSHKPPEVIFFEHGSAPSGFSSHEKSIVHAHTHVAIGASFDQKYIDMVQLKIIEDIKELRECKYMTYQLGAKGQLMAVWDPEVYVQRQFPRQVIGKMYGIKPELTNWRNEPFAENITRTLSDILEILHTKNFPKRIMDRTKGFVDGYPLRKKSTMFYLSC